jgi:hypothetical protein
LRTGPRVWACGDLKIATASAALRFGPRLAQPTFRDDAERTVAIRHRMQAITMASLRAVRMGGQPSVLRRLLPSEDRVELATLKQTRVPKLLHTVGACLAWDQLRNSGRDGSASADAMIAHGGARGWQRPLLALASRCADQTERKYGLFLRAREAGSFD